MKTRALILAALAVASLAAEAASIRKNFRVEEKFTLREGGALVLENPVGDVHIIGTDAPGVDTLAIKSVVGIDANAVEEGRQRTALIVGGDDTTRVLRAAMPPVPSKSWSSRVNWRVKVPRSTHVRVITNSGERILIQNILGNVVVKNINGEIVLENSPATANVESVNGDIIYSAPQPVGNATLSTVNGDVTVRVKADVDFRFVAEAIRGDILTNLPVRGGFANSAYRGTVNAPGGPTFQIGTLMGNVSLLAHGPQLATPVSLKKGDRPKLPSAVLVESGRNTPTVRLPVVQGLYEYATSLGNVKIGEIHGDANIFTGAGEVQLGHVRGSLKVRSHGGPLTIGTVDGTILATTRAGNILVESARRGGEIATQGGTVRLISATGPTQLFSGGGDITVRKASAPISALTNSGDVFLTMDPKAKSHAISARTAKGNVVVHVGSTFSADVTATIVTTDPTSHAIISDIPGLSISREVIDGKTRIRATGKINGGGEKMELEATDGGIRISTGPVGPSAVPR